MRPPWTERGQAADAASEGEREQLGRAEPGVRSARLDRLGPLPVPVRVEGDHAPGWVASERIRPADEREARGVPRVLWYGADVSVALSRRRAPMPYAWRNVDADDLLWIASGEGTCRTDYGPLRYGAGDFLVLPRGTTWRLAPADADGLSLWIQSRASLEIDEACREPDPLELPQLGDGLFSDADSDAEIEIRVQRAGQLTSFFYAEPPPPVTAWRGALYPSRLPAKQLPAWQRLFRGRGWLLSAISGGGARGTTPSETGVSQTDVDRDVIVCRADDARMLWAPAGAARPLAAPPSREANGRAAIALEAFAPLVVTPDVRRVLHPLA